MKTLPVPLITAQKSPGSKPAAELEVSQFGHPQACPVVSWQWFAWEQLYSTDGIDPACHGLAIPADGSLNRVRLSTGSPYYVMHQRVASPDSESDFTSWTRLDRAYSTTAIAVAALGTEVCIYYAGSVTGQVYEKKSTDSGDSFASSTLISSPSGVLGQRCLSACYKDATHLCLVFVDTADNQLRVGIRSGGSWSFHSFGTSIAVYWTAVYFDGDYNIIALVNRNEVFSLARIVFGAGYRQAADTFSSVDYLNTASASVYAWEIINNYMGSLPPYSDFDTARDEFISHIKRAYTQAQLDYMRNRPNPYFSMAGSAASGKGGMRPVYPRGWDANSAIRIGRATDNIDLDFPFICQPSGHPPIMTFIRSGERWTFRLKPGTDFYDNYWGLAYSQNLSTPYGLAVASDGTYVWGTRANEVWRMPIPGVLQVPPTAGTGEGDSITIPQADIVTFQESVFPHSTSNLLIELDNCAGDYNGLPDGYIRKGSQVRLKYGFVAQGVPQYNPGDVYFIEDWSYERSPNRTSVVLHCIDAWGLLANFTIPAPAEINFIDDQYTVYELIEVLVRCIGGTLTYVSRSDAMTSLYPRLLINAGETAAGVMYRLLDLVPDVLRFDGLTCYVINPQETDQPVYRYHFPYQEERT
jgi:hypothetical protein